MEAIVYTSNSGFTEKYAKMLGKKTGLPVYELSAANKELSKGTSVIYLGWVFANNVKGCAKALKQYSVSAVCAVGLSETGTMSEEVRKAVPLPEDIPLFTIQGGMDHSKLHGINKLLIQMLVKGLSSRKDLSEQEKHMRSLIQKDGDYTDEKNLSAVMEWYHTEKEI